MEKNHKLGLYVSYYLSRFNESAYARLGYGNQNETHKRVGELLNINPYTVNNWRDEFDPMFGFRVGWYQRPMSPSRQRVVQALEDLDEQHVFYIVEDILSGKIKEDPTQEDILIAIASEKSSTGNQGKFIQRGPTGKAAEDFFIKYHSDNKLPINGDLEDCRDLGCGYDFIIRNLNAEYFVEVKGLAANSGGIQFTDKEWNVAKEEGDHYYLCIVSNIGRSPDIFFILDPAKIFAPKKNIYTSIQISWSVSPNQLAQHNIKTDV